MPPKITREVVESYLKCRHKGNLQLAGEQGSTSDYEMLLRESRARVQAAAAAKLVRDQKCGVLQDMALTLEVLTRGVSLLLDVTAEDEQLSICFDGLRRSAGASRLGEFHYIPILIHEAERFGKDQKALLEFLGLVLGAIQAKQPCWGMLIHGRSSQVRRVKLGGGITQAQKTLQELMEMRGTGMPTRLRLNTHCQVCEFRQRCNAEAASKDDLSLLRGMSEKEVNKYTLASTNGMWISSMQYSRNRCVSPN